MATTLPYEITNWKALGTDDFLSQGMLSAVRKWLPSDIGTVYQSPAIGSVLCAISSFPAATTANFFFTPNYATAQCVLIDPVPWAPDILGARYSVQSPEGLSILTIIGYAASPSDTFTVSIQGAAPIAGTWTLVSGIGVFPTLEVQEVTLLAIPPVLGIWTKVGVFGTGPATLQVASLSGRAYKTSRSVAEFTGKLDVPRNVDGTPKIWYVTDPEGNQPKNWSYEGVGDIIHFLDPDNVVAFFTEMVDTERVVQTNTVQSILNLLDPDTCPTEYLPYLAATIGYRLEADDPEILQRAQIKSAVAWYKEKGMISAFELLFITLGYTVSIYPLWFNKQGVSAFPSSDPRQQSPWDIDPTNLGVVRSVHLVPLADTYTATISLTSPVPSPVVGTYVTLNGNSVRVASTGTVINGFTSSLTVVSDTSSYIIVSVGDSFLGTTVSGFSQPNLLIDDQPTEQLRQDWLSKHGNDLWRPHARIDILLETVPGRTIPPITQQKLDDLLQRMEEVRPVHVLVRGIFTSIPFNDYWNGTLGEDTLVTPPANDILDIEALCTIRDKYVWSMQSACLTFFNLQEQAPAFLYDGVAMPFHWGWESRFQPPYPHGPVQGIYNGQWGYEDPWTEDQRLFGDYKPVTGPDDYNQPWCGVINAPRTWHTVIGDDAEIGAVYADPQGSLCVILSKHPSTPQPSTVFRFSLRNPAKAPVIGTWEKISGVGPSFLTVTGFLVLFDNGIKEIQYYNGNLDPTLPDNWFFNGTSWIKLNPGVGGIRYDGEIDPSGHPFIFDYFYDTAMGGYRYNCNDPLKRDILTCDVEGYFNDKFGHPYFYNGTTDPEGANNPFGVIKYNFWPTGQPIVPPYHPAGYPTDGCVYFDGGMYEPPGDTLSVGFTLSDPFFNTYVTVWDGGELWDDVSIWDSDVSVGDDLIISLIHV